MAGESTVSLFYERPLRVFLSNGARRKEQVELPADQPFDALRDAVHERLDARFPLELKHGRRVMGSDEDLRFVLELTKSKDVDIMIRVAAAPDAELPPTPPLPPSLAPVSGPQQMLSFFKFSPLSPDERPVLQAQLRQMLTRLGARGTVYLAPEAHPLRQPAPTRDAFSRRASRPMWQGLNAQLCSPNPNPNPNKGLNAQLCSPNPNPNPNQGMNAQLCVPLGAAEELVAELEQLKLGLEPNLAEVVAAELLPFDKLLVRERPQARARRRAAAGHLAPPPLTSWLSRPAGTWPLPPPCAHAPVRVAGADRRAAHRARLGPGRQGAHAAGVARRGAGRRRGAEAADARLPQPVRERGGQLRRGGAGGHPHLQRDVGHPPQQAAHAHAHAHANMQHATCMAYAWHMHMHMHGMCMACARYVHGMCMCMWHVHGMCMWHVACIASHAHRSKRMCGRSSCMCIACVHRTTFAKLRGRLDGVPSDTPIMTYCTGGIRCVKVNAFLEQSLGFSNTMRLQDGINGYLRFLREEQADDSAWRGQNFVFDKRTLVQPPADSTTGDGGGIEGEDDS